MIKKAFAAVAAISLVFISSCSSGVTSVQAATGYSNASVSGTYAFSSASAENTVGYIGTITTDGNGNITSGNLTTTYDSTSFTPSTLTTCTVSLTGTYSIQTSGAGTATLSVTPSGTSPCSISSSNNLLPGTVSLALEVAQQGTTIVAIENGSWFFAFTAVKQ